MAHFGYVHLPAQGLGHRDPRRAHVTGGISAGSAIFFTCLGDHREPFYGLMRDPLSGERFAVFGIDRLPIYATRGLVLVSKREPLAGLIRTAVRTTVVNTITEFKPSADVTVTGPLTDSVGGNDNGIMFDDLNQEGRYITHERVGFFGQLGTLILDLTDGLDPGIDTGHTMVVRARNSIYNLISNYSVIEVGLFDFASSTLVWTETKKITGPFDTWVDHRLEIPEASAALITDYDQLQIFLSFKGGLDPLFWDMDLDHIWLETSVLSYITETREPAHGLHRSKFIPGNRSTDYGERALATGSRNPPENDVC